MQLLFFANLILYFQQIFQRNGLRELIKRMGKRIKERISSHKLENANERTVRVKNYLHNRPITPTD